MAGFIRRLQKEQGIMSIKDELEEKCRVEEPTQLRSIKGWAVWIDQLQDENESLEKRLHVTGGQLFHAQEWIFKLGREKEELLRIKEYAQALINNVKIRYRITDNCELTCSYLRGLAMELDGEGLDPNNV